MLDLKTPFEVRDSAIVPFQPRLVLADLPGVSAVLVMPNFEDLQNWAASIERLSPTPGSSEDLHELLRPGLARELRSMEEVSDEFSHLGDYRAKLADLAEKVGDWDEARRLSVELVDDCPGPASAYRLARLLIDEGNLASAKRVLIDHVDELDFLGLLRLAQVHALLGSLDDCEAVVDDAIASNPTDYRGWMFKGTLAMASKQWTLAMRAFRAAIEEPNNSSTLRVNLAFTYVATGQVHKALRELRVASRINPGDENAVALLCDLALQQRTPDIAASAIDNHFAAGGRTRVFLERAAKTFFAIGEEIQHGRSEYLQAKKYLANLLSQENEPHQWNNLGVVESRLGNTLKALKHFSHSYDIAMDTDCDWSLALSNILVTRIEQRLYTDVERATRELFNSKRVLSQQYWPKIALQRSAALEGLGLQEDAAEFLESVIHEPRIDNAAYAEMLSSLTIYYTSVSPNQDNVEGYISELHRIVLANSSDLSERQYFRVSNNLAFALLQLGEIERARDVLAPIQSQVGKNPYFTATYGLEKLKSGKPQAAESLYDKAVSIASDKKLKDRIKQRKRFEFAQYYYERGDLVRARQYAVDSLKPKLGFAHIDKRAKILIAQLENSKDMPDKGN